MIKTDYADHVPNLFDSVLSDLGSADSNMMVIRHYNTIDFTADYVEELARTRDQACFLYHSFQADDMLGGYEPFVDWIRQLYYGNSQEPLEEFFENSGVYFLHRPIFQSYFETGLARRTEELLLIECEFEQEKFVEEIANMLCRLSFNKPLVLVFNKLHAAGKSTIQVLEKLLDKRCGERIAIVATYNDNAVKLSYMKKTWKRLFDKLEEQDCVIDWILDSTPMDTDFHSEFQYNNRKLSDYNAKLNNMFQMLALDQAVYYLDILYHKFEIEKAYIEPYYKFSFLELYAKISMYQNRTSDALLYHNGMRNLINGESNPEWEYRYHYLAAQIYMYSFQQDMARRHVEKCVEIARQEKQEYSLFQAELLQYMVEFHGWRDIWRLKGEDEADEELVRKAEKYGYYNHIANMHVFSCDNAEYRFQHIDQLDESLSRSNRGILWAKQQGNERLVIEGYKKNVMMASTNGYYDVANYFDGKCQEIVAGRQDRSEEAAIYNGMGYNCSTMEKYVEANEYYNKALLLYVRMNGIDCINETIYNMAINAILAEEYQRADSYLGICLKIIEITKANSVRVCNITKVYGLRAYCNYRMGVIYKCKNHMQYVERFLGHIIPLEDEDKYSLHIWDDDLFLYYFVNALLYEQEDQLQQALVYFQKAAKYLERSKGSMFFNLPPYSIEYADLCRRLGDEEKAEKILTDCLAYCDAKGYAYKGNFIRAKLEGKDYSGKKWQLDIQGVSFDEILEIASRVGMERDYERQKNQIHFVGVWQKLTNSLDTSIEGLIENAITTLKDNNNLDELMFIRMEDGVPVMKYNDTTYDMTDEKVEYMVEYFSRNRKAFAITRLDKGYSEHKEFIDKVFGFHAINTLICAPIFVNERLSSLFVACVLINEDWNYNHKRFKFDENDLAIMMTLFRQLYDALERLEAQNKIKSINQELHDVNDKLKQMSVRDNLTGLYNRQGFSEKLEELVKENRMFHQQLTLSFLYADLDNFKYYNDTFGHDIGDLILKEFSALINSICQNRGYAVRYGGDEFILVLYSSDREEIEEAARRIYTSLEAEQGFTRKISDTLGKQIEIPEDRYVSCSIGISNADIAPEDDSVAKIEQTLKHADEMMYYVKKTTKHRYVFYDDAKKR